MIVQGNKALYGASIGILMLEARFPRIPGDMGNAETWPFPVHYRIVRGASPDRVVRRGAEGLLPDFIAAAKELVHNGVDGITTNCGFLSLFQSEIAAAVPVPVATSALMQAGMVRSLLPPGRKLGILTISAQTLTARHLAAAGVGDDCFVAGVAEGCAFQTAILDNAPRLDVGASRQDMIDAALAMQQAEPALGAIIFECTNMSPYAADVHEATGLPVYSIYTLIRWFQASLRPPVFPAPSSANM